LPLRRTTRYAGAIVIAVGCENHTNVVNRLTFCERSAIFNVGSCGTYSAGLLSLFCGAGNLAKFGLHAGNMDLNTQKEEWIKILIGVRIFIILAVFFYASYVIKI
jgi:hypothetical protein